MWDLLDALLVSFYLFIFVQLFFMAFNAFCLLKILHRLNHPDEEPEGVLIDVV